MNNSIGKINTELLIKSSETISGVANIIYNTDFVSQFLDMEEYFRLINFEHSNCLVYKDSLELIYSDLREIKSKIMKLSDALRITEENFKEADNLNVNDAVQLSKIYKETPSSSKLSELLNLKDSLKTSIDNASEENITKIPSVDQTTATIEEKPYSTVPIGLAIGATGIAGSVGAVVVDEKYGPSVVESEIDEYYDMDDDEPDFTVKEPVDKKKEEEILPYHASRSEREADKYYGSQKDEINLDSYEEDTDNPDDY